MNTFEKVYLGDSVYAKFDGFSIVLTADNGDGPNRPSNTIILEPPVLANLSEYARAIVRTAQDVKRAVQAVDGVDLLGNRPKGSETTP